MKFYPPKHHAVRASRLSLTLTCVFHPAAGHIFEYFLSLSLVVSIRSDISVRQPKFSIKAILWMTTYPTSKQTKQN